MTDIQLTPSRRVGWDPLIRMTHWGIAFAIVINGFLSEEGSQLHIWVGYAALAMLVLRLLWGVVGPKEARFASFPPSLSAARGHLADLWAGNHRVYPSHNPLGRLMVYALWGTLAVVTATGIGMAGSPFKTPADDHAGLVSVALANDHEDHGKEYGDEYDDDYEDEDEGNEVLEDIHEAAANLLLILAGVHVAGVVFESRVSGTNLVRAMLSGRREA
ncbi:MAG: cytochrome b/b6 domain-containing protein [Alphaproteobacteria bacterium]|nr:cytochrome b/b6 domain-containing protein [Alphaproteobacteria bacterium]